MWMWSWYTYSIIQKNCTKVLVRSSFFLSIRSWLANPGGTPSKECLTRFLQTAVLAALQLQGCFSQVMEKKTGLRWYPQSPRFFLLTFRSFNLERNRLTSSAVANLRSLSNISTTNHLMLSPYEFESKVVTWNTFPDVYTIIKNWTRASTAYAYNYLRLLPRVSFDNLIAFTYCH